MWESHLIRMSYTGLRMAWGGSCASGSTEERHKATKKKEINYCGNSQDIFLLCEVSMLHSATLCWQVFKQTGLRSIFNPASSRLNGMGKTAHLELAAPVPQCWPSRDGEQLLKKWLSGCGFSAWPAKAKRCDEWLGGNNSFGFNVPSVWVRALTESQS